MEDRQIVELYWNRSESAITETDIKYGLYCHTIAWQILFCEEDSKECVNDTYLQAWNAIPPHRPDPLIEPYPPHSPGWVLFLIFSVANCALMGYNDTLLEK